MREKNVEERFARYFEFGVRPDGKVDLASRDNSALVSVTPEEARRLITDRDAAVDMITQLALKLAEVAPDEFSKLWYGPKS